MNGRVEEYCFCLRTALKSAVICYFSNFSTKSYVKRLHSNPHLREDFFELFPDRPV